DDAGDAISAASDAGDVDATVTDAGDVEASSVDAGADGDAGASAAYATVPFDISQYSGITFWGRTDIDEGGGVDLKVLFPDWDTDPRGGVCNGPPADASSSDISQCYNSYAVHVTLHSGWQQYFVLFSNVQIDPSRGYQGAQWDATKVYGIDWQEQDNATPDSTNQPMDLWIDDVYFIK
ncbi:MAG: hypothetical protein FWD17_16240, partial [Polyangiaceae bacterium]|nr:hypothetical protein [Polyangiaceae bacterium]